MQTPIERIRELKTGAKNQRDRSVRGYPRALSMLQEAIGIARTELESSSLAGRRVEMAKELSDCCGIVGGVQRRWADETTGDERSTHLKLSIAAYDEGSGFESDRQYGIVNSYNLVNRLLVRLVLEPGALAANNLVVIDPPPDIAPLNLTEGFEEAAVTIRKQLTESRRGDYWAMADLALIDVLLGRSSAAVAYADFVGASPPDFAYDSAIAALGPLVKLKVDSAPELQEAVNLLKDRLQRLRS